jgi:hypothetical protein
MPPSALSARDGSIRHRSGLSAPSPKALAAIAASSSQVGFSDRANRGWRKLYDDAWFTRHYAAISPSQWATQVIGQDLLFGLSNHLRNVISTSDPFCVPSLPILPLA